MTMRVFGVVGFLLAVALAAAFVVGSTIAVSHFGVAAWVLARFGVS